MPSFKHKTNKKIYVDKKRIMTLDGVHRELQLEFNLINSVTLPDLINRKNEMGYLCIIIKYNFNNNYNCLYNEY